jgi:hypothetical protein
MRNQKNKLPKPNKQSHVQNTKYGMGDYYGQGIRQKMGKSIVNQTMIPLSKKKIGTPPKSIV